MAFLPPEQRDDEEVFGPYLPARRKNPMIDDKEDLLEILKAKLTSHAAKLELEVRTLNEFQRAVKDATAVLEKGSPTTEELTEILSLNMTLNGKFEKDQEG